MTTNLSGLVFDANLTFRQNILFDSYEYRISFKK